MADPVGTAARRAMWERDSRLMRLDTATPILSGRVEALADRCAVEGLENCAATLRLLLAEVTGLTTALHEIAGSRPSAAGCNPQPMRDAARRALVMVQAQLPQPSTTCGDALCAEKGCQRQAGERDEWCPLGPAKQSPPIMCGGCGATSDDQRCIGCHHDFGTPESAWVRDMAKQLGVA